MFVSFPLLNIFQRRKRDKHISKLRIYSKPRVLPITGPDTLNKPPLSVIILCFMIVALLHVCYTVRIVPRPWESTKTNKNMENLKEGQMESECSFKFHDFVAEVGHIKLACHTIKMDNCLYLWVGDSRDNVMNDLSFAIESRFSKEPVTTKIIGPISSESSNNLAKRLSMKLSKPVYVSFNVQVDNISLPVIERRLKEEFDAHPDIL